jgi:Fe-S cluster assembly protein SufD
MRARANVKPETAAYVGAFRAQPRREHEPHWLLTRREAALANFAEKGFPTRRDEAWRFTNLRSLERTTFLPASGGVAAPGMLERYRLAGPTHRLVLVNGRFAPELSALDPLPAGVTLASTAAMLARQPDALAIALDASDTVGGQPFASLNAAFFADGFVLTLEPGVCLDRPVEIVHLGAAETPVSLHLRNLVVLGAGCRASLVESFAGDGPYWTNAVTSLHLGRAAELRHVKLQDEGRAAFHVAMTRARLGKAARYDAFGLTLGAGLSRQDVQVRLEEEGAAVSVDGAYLLRGEQEATNAVVIDHAAPGGTTRELFKGVMEDRAHGVFLGTINVRPDAQRTDAQQLNNNLLLSPRASIDTKPELEILADDVKCSHGATVGDLDEDALFYLRTRGIPLDQARRMLVEAFAMAALERVEDRMLRDHLAGAVQRWLGGERDGR